MLVYQELKSVMYCFLLNFPFLCFKINTTINVFHFIDQFFSD